MSEELNYSEIDGVPVVHARGRGNHYQAGLVFRVGRADETVATAGISHLVEHLALHQQGVGEFHFNGATADLFTHFHLEGTAEQVVEYFRSVCASLRELPLQRLQIEKEILRTERTGRGAGAAQQLPAMRHGAQGYGISSYDEIGLPALTADLAQHWAWTHFTRENAVFWVIGDGLPAGLRLDLMAGQWNPPPSMSSILPTTPAWYRGQAEVTVLQAMVPRSTAAMVFANVLSNALFADLRQRGGYSYTAQANYQPMTAEMAEIVAVADNAPDKRDAAVGAFVDVLARLRLGTIATEELETVRSTLHRTLADVETSHRVPGRAFGLLLGGPQQSPEEVLAELDQVTVADLRRVAEQVHASSLFQVPTAGLDWAGVAPVPMWSEEVVLGQEFAPHSPADGALVVGGEGVSIRYGERASTVRYADCVAMQVYADGGRRLFGRDGFTVPIEPTLHRVDSGVLHEVVQGVRPAVHIPMPARTPDQLPTPSAAEWSAAPGTSEPPAAKSKDNTVAILSGTAVVVLGLVGLGLLISGVQGMASTGFELSSWDLLRVGKLLLKLAPAAIFIYVLVTRSNSKR